MAGGARFAMSVNNKRSVQAAGFKGESKRLYWTRLREHESP